MINYLNSNFMKLSKNNNIIKYWYMFCVNSAAISIWLNDENNNLKYTYNNIILI